MDRLTDRPNQLTRALLFLHAPPYERGIRLDIPQRPEPAGGRRQEGHQARPVDPVAFLRCLLLPLLDQQPPAPGGARDDGAVGLWFEFDGSVD